MIICQNCGNKIENDNAKFCSTCGETVAVPEEKPAFKEIEAEVIPEYRNTESAKNTYAASSNSNYGNLNACPHCGSTSADREVDGSRPVNKGWRCRDCRSYYRTLSDVSDDINFRIKGLVIVLIVCIVGFMIVSPLLNSFASEYDIQLALSCEGKQETAQNDSVDWDKWMADNNIHTYEIVEAHFPSHRNDSEYEQNKNMLELLLNMFLFAIPGVAVFFTIHSAFALVGLYRERKEILRRKVPKNNGGATSAASPERCDNCGEKLRPGAKTCFSCGKTVR